MNTKNKLASFDKASAASLILRLSLGGVIFAHGAQKMFGWFGGHGYSWTLEAWGRWFQFPEILTHLVIWGEFFAPIMLLIGLFTRFAATVVGLIMIGAIAVVHAPWGFFMNWYMQPQRGEGFEYHLLALGMVIGLLFLGGGKWAVSNYLLTAKKGEGSEYRLSRRKAQVPA